MRRFLAVLLIALALATLAVYARAVMSPLTLSIGSGAVTLVQSQGVGYFLGGIQPNQTLPSPSTAGTTLLAFVANHSGTGATPTTAAGPGWVRQAVIAQGSNSELEVWAYFNNPGGIRVISFTGAASITTWLMASFEYQNLAGVSVLDAVGTASATAGTTLTPTTSTAILGVGDLALAAWLQVMAAPASVTFTTPPGWTRLMNDDGFSASSHLDLQYFVAPPTGATLGPTLTSTGTTSSAVGGIIVLKAAPPVTDQTAYIAY